MRLQSETTEQTRELKRSDGLRNENKRLELQVNDLCNKLEEAKSRLQSYDSKTNQLKEGL